MPPRRRKHLSDGLASENSANILPQRTKHPLKKSKLNKKSLPANVVDMSNKHSKSASKLQNHDVIENHRGQLISENNKENHRTEVMSKSQYSAPCNALRVTRNQAQKLEEKKLSLHSHEASIYVHYRESLSDAEEEELSEDQLLEQLTLLKALHKKEKELKTSILFEKLKKEEQIIVKEDLLLKNIETLQKKSREIEADLKLKQCNVKESQLAETLLRIVRPQLYMNKNKMKEKYEFSDENRRVTLDFLLKKKELNKEISHEQQQITELECSCVELLNTINHDATDIVFDPSLENELILLANENTKRNSRIHLLSKIIQSLIRNLETKHNLKDDIKVLSSLCEKIQNWNYEDLDEMEELCKSVCSTQI